MFVLAMATALFAPLLGSIAVAALRPTGLAPGRFMVAACAASSLAALALVARVAIESVGSIGGATTTYTFGLDRPSAILLAAVSSLALVVASFARRNLDVDPRAPRFFMLFGLLVTGSALVVVPASPWLLVAGWVGSSWALVGLVGHNAERPSSRRAQQRTAQALIVGDVALVAAIVLAVIAAGQDVTRDLGASLDDLRSFSVLGTSAADIVAILLVVAGVARSSLVPLHRWLVTTLAAPTPVSALVHAGFVSGAGLLLLRFAPLVIDSTVAIHLAFGVGVVTTCIAVGAGRTRLDVKGKLAWSTVSQMGFMVVQCAVGAFSSAVFHIVGHGMYKASMFLGAGDAVSASLRSKRRAAPGKLPSATTRLVVALGSATAAIVVGLLLVPPNVSDGGFVLVAVFSWLTVANGVWGFLGRGAQAPAASIATAVVGGFVATFAYLVPLRGIEAFLEPTLRDVPTDAGVEAITLIVVLAFVAAAAAVATSSSTLTTRLDVWFERVAHPGVSDNTVATAPASTPAASPAPAETSNPAQLSRIRADVARAQKIIAPSWPLTSFVAVNPLGGLEDFGFERASEIARRDLRARTHMTLDRYRADHAGGLSTTDDLQWSIASAYPTLTTLAPIDVDGAPVSPERIVEIDLLHGPDTNEVFAPQTAVERVEGVDGPVGKLIDLTISHSAAQHLARSRPASSHGAGISFAERWRRDATSIAALRRHLPADAVAWLHSLTDDPAETIAAAFAVSSVPDDNRVLEMRGHLARLNGWTGFARWRTEWAHKSETLPDIRPAEIVAARSALEAAWLRCRPDLVVAEPAEVAPASGDFNADRVDAVTSILGITSPTPELLDQIRAILAVVRPDDRAAIWLSAQERNVDQRTLATLDRLDPGPRLDAPKAQLVFCIDVRSEGLRRHLEATGPYDTLGFAGFFGVPMSVQRLEWDNAEPRCPVLVAPSVSAVERPRTNPQGGAADVSSVLTRSRRSAAAAAVHSHAKYGAGAAFVMAEAAGWLAGPVAAARTLLPIQPSPVSQPPTTMEINRLTDANADIEQRIEIGEAVLRTMGLTDRFASLVVLCGHASDNVNNPHATALDCGACAGASGQDNGRAVAALLNEPAVRAGLRERDIDVPDETHFLAALHETVSDRVDFFDLVDLPATHQAALDRLRQDLATAARHNTAERARHLPGRAASTRRRGTDWGQVRPEWGLARNAAFVIGPRSMTAGLDLGSRSFLHSYEAENDPDGKVLETIMTAPLVVAHWISSQYYFSTVDPERFGAGDKLVHNVVGDLGVISGEHGDLRIGLPLQSTHLGNQPHHQPVRLLAVVQAPLERIERIIEQNPILTTLIGGSWMRLAGRSHPHERWSVRTPAGTWIAEPRLTATNTTDTTDNDTHTDLEQP